MSDIKAWIEDLHQLRPGDHVEVWDDARLLYNAVVDQVAPVLHVAWVMEAGLRQRRMVDTSQHRLYPCVPGASSALRLAL